MFEEAQSVLSRAGMDPKHLDPEIFVDLINNTMRDINEGEDGASIYIARAITVPTVSGERFVRPRWLLGGSAYLSVVRIMKASYDGEPLHVESPMQFPGTVESGTSVDTGIPRSVWIEDEQWVGPTGPPVSEQLWGVDPLPDAAYNILATCCMPLPDYAEWGAVLPVKLQAHKVVFDGVLAEMFESDRYRDQMHRQKWWGKYRRGVVLLQNFEKRLIGESPIQIDTTSFDQVD